MVKEVKGNMEIAEKQTSCVDAGCIYMGNYVAVAMWYSDVASLGKNHDAPATSLT